MHYKCKVSQDSSVGIATGCGLDGPEIEYGEGEVFRIRPEWPLAPTLPSIQGVPGHSGGKAAGTCH
jgi:hypothetical protein